MYLANNALPSTPNTAIVRGMTKDEENALFDAVIMECATEDFIKINVLISRAFDALPEAGLIPHSDTGQEIAERIYILIDNGALLHEGNMRRWRDAQVKLRTL